MNLNHYSTAKKEVQAWFLRQEGRDIVQCISVISVATHIPAIVCAFWIGEVSGWTQPVMDNIQTLIKCYNYKDIGGIPDSYPGEKI